MVTLEYQRRVLRQWDKNQRVVLDGYAAGTDVHFSMSGCYDDKAPCVKTYEQDGKVYANIPNIFLCQPGKLYMYVYLCGRDDEGHTQEVHEFVVVARPKPDEYIYEETELWSAEKAVEDALAAAKARGDFKGDKGDKGEPGVVRFVVVNELPEVGDTDAMYLLPITESEEGNLFDEYIFVDGKWEKIGSTAVEVNLDEYVKKTDYATNLIPGVVIVGEGLIGSSNGKVNTFKAKDSEIVARSSNYRPIVPANLDYAVKVGLTTNTIDLTDDEKTAAQTWLGIKKALTITVINGNTASHTATEIYEHTQAGGVVMLVNAGGTTCALSSFTANYAYFESIWEEQLHIYRISRHGILKTFKYSLSEIEKIASLEQAVGDIETALDSIIEIQNGLIGGGTE